MSAFGRQCGIQIRGISNRLHACISHLVDFNRYSSLWWPSAALGSMWGCDSAGAAQSVDLAIDAGIGMPSILVRQTGITQVRVMTRHKGHSQQRCNLPMRGGFLREISEWVEPSKQARAWWPRQGAGSGISTHVPAFSGTALQFRGFP